uniref:Uncharacterized protein n=1 Tax=Arundo donax TaxID=35708 RepID=A0A0A9VD95_ARUDO
MVTSRVPCSRRCAIAAPHLPASRTEETMRQRQ